MCFTERFHPLYDLVSLATESSRGKAAAGGPGEEEAEGELREKTERKTRTNVGECLERGGWLEGLGEKLVRRNEVI